MKIKIVKLLYCCIAKARGFTRHKTAPGFTLIELLIAMAIISILATGLIMVINPVVQIQKASDSRRKADIAQIQKALEAYYQDNGAYPASSVDYEITAGGSVIKWGDPWLPYMGNLPKDPKSPAKDYAYYAPSDLSEQTYYLYASLDRENDSQACNGGTDCPSVPSANQCGGKPCNYGVSTPNVDVAMGVPTVPPPAPTSTPTPTPTPTPSPTPTPTLTPSPTPTPTPVPPAPPIGWWKMDGNANDSSGNGNNGTVTGATLTTDKNGVSDRAYSFDGIDDYLRVTNTPGPEVATAFSMTAWIKPNTVAPAYQAIIGKAGIWTRSLFLSSGTHLRSYVGHSPTAAISESTGAIAANTWFHVAMVFSASTIRLYINGAEIGSYVEQQVGSGTEASYATGQLEIGGALYPFNGTIDDVRIYNSALSAAQVLAIYNAGP